MLQAKLPAHVYLDVVFTSVTLILKIFVYLNVVDRCMEASLYMPHLKGVHIV